MRVWSFQLLRSQFFRRIAGTTIPLVLLPLALGGQIQQSEYAARRAALAKLLGNGIVVAIGSPERKRITSRSTRIRRSCI